MVILSSLTLNIFILSKILEVTNMTMTIDQLRSYLQQNTNTATLQLQDKQIDDVGAKLIADFAKSNKAMTNLYLWDNNIGDPGAKDLGDSLKANTSLTQLSLQSNQIGDPGAKDLGDSLKANTSLTSLYLYSNNIGDEGAKGLGDGLKSNASLTQLYLGTNKIEDKGAKGLIEGLQRNSTLKYTSSLSGNNVSSDLINKFKALVAENYSYPAKALARKVAYHMSDRIIENKKFTNKEDLYFKECYDKADKKLIAKALPGIKELVKKISELLVKNFSKEISNKVDIPLNVLKIYQYCDKELLLKNYVGNDKEFNKCTKAVEQYIGQNFTQLSGLSRRGDLTSNYTNEAKSPFAIADLSAKISSYLPRCLLDIKIGSKNFDVIKDNFYLFDFLKMDDTAELLGLPTDGN